MVQMSYLFPDFIFGVDGLKVPALGSFFWGEYLMYQRYLCSKESVEICSTEFVLHCSNG